MKIKAGNKYTRSGKCSTDSMYSFIKNNTGSFNSINISLACFGNRKRKEVNRASDFLRVLYKKGYINKSHPKSKKTPIFYYVKRNTGIK